MINKQYTFNIESQLLQEGIINSLSNLYYQKMPVIVCVGTDGVVGDCLGPLVGTMLKEKNLPAFIYG